MSFQEGRHLDLQATDVTVGLDALLWHHLHALFHAFASFAFGQGRILVQVVPYAGRFNPNRRLA